MANNGGMKLHKWTSAQHGRMAWIAAEIGVSSPVVSDWCTGKKSIPVERCVPIERATDGAVTRRDLRPDDWADIWPELAQTPATPTSTATQPVAIQAV